MYRLEITGRNLEEFKKAVADINNVLQSGEILGKVKEHKVEFDVTKEAVQFKTEVEAPTITMDKSLLPKNTVDFGRFEPVAQPITINSNAELDAEGLPWDARIHTTKKTKTVKGIWKNARGVDKDLVEQVRHELKNAVTIKPAAIPVIPTTPVQQTITPVPTLEVPQPVATPVFEMPVQQLVLPSNGGHTLETFKTNFPMIVASLITEKKLTQEYVNQLNEYFGVQQIFAINDNQKAEMFENFANCGFITKA